MLRDRRCLAIAEHVVELGQEIQMFVRKVLGPVGFEQTVELIRRYSLLLKFVQTYHVHEMSAPAPQISVVSAAEQRVEIAVQVKILLSDVAEIDAKTLEPPFT